MEEKQDEAAASESPQAPRPRGRKRKILVRLGAVLLAIVAGLFVSFFTVDLGPSLKDRAERAGSNYLRRPLHIGKLSARMIPGVYVVEDVRIEGLRPEDRPFLVAKKITVTFPWWTIFQRPAIDAKRLLLIESIDMTDWDMLVESWPNGRHNFPKVTPDRKPNQQPGWFGRNVSTRLRNVTAARGKFTYDDHGMPWLTVTPNLTVQISWSDVTRDYRGRATFSDGMTHIMSYEPFGLSMQSRFHFEGRRVIMDRIDLTSDGAQTVAEGWVDLGRWPEQLYNVRSHIDFPTQKNIYFHKDDFTVTGQGDFQGTFRMFSGGRELKGTFTSPVAGVGEWRFPRLKGNVYWVRDRLEITDATSDLYGGRARFDYRMAPFGKPGVPTMAMWDVAYEDVDLVRLTDFLETRGLRLAGRISGTNSLVWPSGKWAQKRGHGEVIARAPAGVKMQGRELRAEDLATESSLPPEAGPFNANLSLGYLPVEGRIVYQLDPNWITLDESWVATPKTYVEFEGRTAYGERSTLPFHVTSLDWQESDRVLAGIMTAFGAPTGAIPLGGFGEFDGVMLGAFGRPRIEGTFRGDRMRAWDVVWGRGTADIVVENSYVDVKNSTLSAGDSAIVADGRFSLGYPRRDKGEEINARVRITRRPLSDLRHAFELDDYPVDGLVSGEFHLYGNYETPFGFGRLVIENGVAYGEPFDTAISSLRFEGVGVRLDSLNIRKASGIVTGAAWVGWEGDYSFTADGRNIPVESLTSLSYPQAPLSGTLDFNASGAGSFEEPRYDVKLRIADLFVADEGIGQINGTLGLRGEMLTGTFEAGSSRLAASGSGRIALTPEMDAEMTLRFQNTSLDPYLRFFEPRLSPFTTAIAGGTIRVVGELADVDHLVVDAVVDQLDLKLFDYQIHNDGPIELSLDQHTVNVNRLRLVGEGTQLQVGGSVNLHDSTLALEATGDANLGILQGFFRNLRSRGTASLLASMTGPLAAPVFAGSARIQDGRIRHFSLPHSLDAINAQVSFDRLGIRIDSANATLGGGDVRFGGRIGLKGLEPGELNLTAVGEGMRLRYPEGFVSEIDADLWLRGTMAAPTLGGNVDVRDALWQRRFNIDPNVFTFAGGGGIIAAPAAATTTVPLRFDIQVNARRSLRIENNIADIVSSAELSLRGTYDRPQLLGRAEIDRGSILFEGNRYQITRGVIDFLDPNRIQPIFDIEAETRVRVPSQTYRITLAVSGTADSPAVNIGSDPPLAPGDIFTLLLGQASDVQNAELRALSPESSVQTEEALLRAMGARLVTNPISGPVARVVEQTLGIDTVQLAPQFGTETDPLTPSARLIIGKRLSSRAYVTYVRPLGTTARDQVIVLEYDQSDRLGFVLTQIADRTFAIDFRVRRSF